MRSDTGGPRARGGGGAPSAAARIRAGRPEDAPALAALRYEFRSAYGDPAEDEEAFVGRCSAWMERRLGPGSRWKAWLAETSDGVQGQVWIGLLDKLPNPAAEAEEHAYLTNLYVRAAWRGGGLGARLLDAAVGWCRERGVDSVFLWPTPRSRSLYRRAGLEPTERMFELRVGADRRPGWDGP